MQGVINTRRCEIEYYLQQLPRILSDMAEGFKQLDELRFIIGSISDECCEFLASVPVNWENKDEVERAELHNKLNSYMEQIKKIQCGALMAIVKL